MDNDSLSVYKTLNKEEFKTKLATLDNVECLVHLRAASIGGVSEGNIHPFETANGVMFHNGTISSFRNKTNKCEVTGCLDSDTKALADLISECKYEKIEDIRPLIQHIITKTANKLAFMENDGTVTIMNKELGNEENEIWYSNSYHVEVKYDNNWQISEEIDKVFVYGTLKEGLSNHGLLANSEFIGKASTLSEYYMVGEGMPFPYVLGRTYEFKEIDLKGHRIKGEIYKVDKATLNRLDLLEGVPSLYTRESIWVQTTETGRVEEVYLYVKATVSPAMFANKMLEEWQPRPVVEVNDTIQEYINDFKTAYEELVIYTADDLLARNKASLEDIYDTLSVMYYGAAQPDYLMPETQELLRQEILELQEIIAEEYEELCE